MMTCGMNLSWTSPFTMPMITNSNQGNPGGTSTTYIPNSENTALNEGFMFSTPY